MIPLCEYCDNPCRDQIIREGPDDFCSYDCLESYQDDTEEV